MSNFNGKGPARAGACQGMGPFGTYDMAGNVKEWCFNQVGGKRYLLGGAWDEPSYMFQLEDAQDPFARRATFGFRCVKYLAQPSPEMVGPSERKERNVAQARPVSDETFTIFKGFYAYDRPGLAERVEGVDERSPFWRREKVSYRAAYGNERVPAWLFLPRGVKPPLQVVVFFPGWNVFMWAAPEPQYLELLEPILRGGRAVLYQVYKGSHERWNEGVNANMGPLRFRDLVIQWYKDLACSLDYLETRKDLDRQRIAYFGFSRGVGPGVVFTALEPRFKASVLLCGGMGILKVAPESDAFNFAPRSKVPTLMVNGRDDFIFPLESSQRPLFHLLGTPPADKRHVVFPGGHIPVGRQAMTREVLDWLDRYLGPVR